MSPLFELDPLFRRTFLLVVPCKAFGKIASSRLFLPVEIYTTLARSLSEKNYVTLEEVSCGDLMGDLLQFSYWSLSISLSRLQAIN